MSTNQDLFEQVPQCTTCQYLLKFICSCAPKCRADMPNLAEGGKDCSRYVPKKILKTSQELLGR